MPRGGDDDVVRLKPYQYIHVHDNNQNVTRVVVGPETFTKKDHEQIVQPPTPCVTIQPRHYCTILNPIARTEDGNIVKDKYGQAKVRLGDEEIRFQQDPFPLYPQEQLKDNKVLPLQVLPVGKALRLRAKRDFEDKAAGDEWLFEGPGTYIPRVEVEIADQMIAHVIKPNSGLMLRARHACKDRTGAQRKSGETWLYTKTGSYLPGVDEEVVKVVNGVVLTPTTALHLEAKRSFTDCFNKKRNAGAKWLVTDKNTDVYIPGPDEEITGTVNIVTLDTTEYCVVVDPWTGDGFADGSQKLGQKEIRAGRTSFFLKPGESLERGIQEVYVLGEQEALLLTAEQAFKDSEDGKAVDRRPGDRWMVYGPTSHIPPVQVKVLERRKSIALGENEGIYVRDMASGQIRAVTGETYMLKPNEELWAKPINAKVAELLARQGAHHHAFLEKSSGRNVRRESTRLVTFSVPHNSVVQVYDYKKRSPRIVFGPDIVMLSPDEEFTVVSLSGDKPKRANCIDTLAIFLGPDFMTDILTVETSDHTQLSLQLSYSWHFDVTKGDPETAKVFNVPDFVGDACSAIASRIRGAVAGVPFDAFHKNSTYIIRHAVFGEDKATGNLRTELRFPNNKLLITSVDIQSVEPTAQKTRDALLKTVQLAIEITTKSQEAAARHAAETREQVAKGELERQIISDKSEAEKERKALLSLQAESAAIESTGASKAEARANAAAAAIDGTSEVEQAKLKADAQAIAAQAELVALQAKQNQELEFKESLNSLEISKEKDMAQIEVDKFKKSVSAIGRDTIAAMARAGPEMQARMLKGLGLQGYLLTDGNSPINLMNAAQSMTGVTP
eukprot:TRINITY_DN7746_c0_g1_i1.p1 TRINITY_DN7746_c0_g1~~TRINITY_DN7746_c0_g1_i1.p1  ORF type:complete len:841 (+),score=171.23 TRINITY_DN7746_c0_g1_i1:48-2570(+)